MADWEAKPAPGSEHDVFLNFRGVDTRHNFTDFLYDRLIDAGVRAFRDEEGLPHGDVISRKLEHAINNSKLYIPIFSPKYASSKWCLRELKLMVDNVCASGDTKSILPIFLLVKPDDVKLKDPLYKAAFEEHEKNNPEEVEAWKTALGKVDEHKGWVVEKNTSQAAIVKLVAQRVLEKLKIKQKFETEDLVGVDDRVKDLMKLLDVDNPKARLIVIYGMGGIGKTTIAKEVFNQLSSHFGKRCSFLKDVRKSSSTEKDIVQLQKQLLSDIVDSEYTKIINNSDQGMQRIREMLPTEKVFVVLDDVHDEKHITILLGNSPLHPRSRIIITTREKMQVKGFEGEIRWYGVPTMDDGHALELFCRHAFDTNFPQDDFRGLSSEIVRRMGGLPLAIKVTSSLLKGEEEEFWKGTLAKLGELPEDEILEVLQISYNDLKDYQQQIFLDIACFLVNEKKTDALYMWANLGVYSMEAIKVLTKRCLIKILENDKIWMHDRLIDLGRHIVRRESLGDLKKQSRLWNAKEALQIIRTKERNDKVQALLIDRMDDSIVIRDEELQRLPNLRFLKLCNGTSDGDFEQCRSKLKWIYWHPSQQDFCTNNMRLNHLIVFKLDWNVFKDDSKAWDLTERVENLKVLSISYDSDITTIPNISKCSSLERLTLENCSSLKIIGSVIGNLQSLIELRIVKCNNLTDLPEEIGALVKLKHFSLWGCPRLSKLPASIGKLTSLTELDLSGCHEIQELPELPTSLTCLCFHSKSLLLVPNLSNLTNLVELLLSNSDDSRETSNLSKASDLRWIGKLYKLKKLELDLVKVPAPLELASLSHLEELVLGHLDLKPLVQLLPFDWSLRKLSTLEISHCEVVDIPLKVLPQLKKLTVSHCRQLQRLSIPSELTKIQQVQVLWCLELVEIQVVGLSKSLEILDIGHCQTLDRIGGLSYLKNLEKLLIIGCNQLTTVEGALLELASLSHLEELVLGHLDLKPLIQLLPSDWSLRELSTLKIDHCEVVDIPLSVLPQLKKLTVGHCRQLQRLSIPSELTKIKQVQVLWCLELVEIKVVGHSKSLEILDIGHCKTLDRIRGLSDLKNLEKLLIIGCNQLTTVEVAPLELASLSHLEELVLGHLYLKPLLQLPPSVWSLRKLSTLKIDHCEVVDIPLKVLPQLKKLNVDHCGQLQRLSIPLELTKIQQVQVLWCLELVEIQVVGLSKSLEILDIGHCKTLDRIRGLSYLKNLKKLLIIGCNQHTTFEILNELASLKYLDVWKYPLLRSLINAACPKIPADCVVRIRECGYSSQDSTFDMLWKNLGDPDNTSNEMESAFTIDFILNRKQSGGEFSVTWRKKMVNPDSVTYEGLIEEVYGLGFVVKGMRYKTPGEDGELFIEINSDEQVKGMVQLASKRRPIQLIVDVSLEGAMARGSPVHLLVLFFCVAAFLLLSLILGFPWKSGQLDGVRRFGLREDFVFIFVLLLFLFLGVKVKRDVSCWDGMDPETVAVSFLRFLAS